MDLRSAWVGFQMAWDAWRRHVSPTTWAAVVDAYDELHFAIDQAVVREEGVVRVIIPTQLERRASGIPAMENIAKEDGRRG